MSVHTEEDVAMPGQGEPQTETSIEGSTTEPQGGTEEQEQGTPQEGTETDSIPQGQTEPQTGTPQTETETTEDAEQNAEQPKTEEKPKGKAKGKADKPKNDKPKAKEEASAEEPKPVGKGDFGLIYDQFKGKAKEAINFLLGTKGGEAIGALHHKDIGDIDLVWGKEGSGHSDGYGLAKLAKFHPEVLGNLQEILDGMRVTQRSDNRVRLENDTHQAAVRLTWDEKKKVWLLTAFEKENSDLDNTTDTAKTSDRGKRNDTATPQNTVPAGKGTTKSPATNDLGEKNAKGEERININPTEGQKKAGNYKMGHVVIDGHKITIENPKGSTRSGKDANGKEWSVKMNYPYGYIRGTESVDGDHVDVYLSDNPTQGNVYVVDQIDQETGEFDEHKVMYGFPSMEAAVEAYKSQYEKGWKVGTVTEVSREDFKKWIDSSKRKTKPFSEYASVRNQKSGELSDANSKAAQSSDLSSTSVGKGTTNSAPAQETGGENSQNGEEVEDVPDVVDDKPQDVEAVNERFNDELQAQIDGKQEAGHVYQLGRPSAILRSTGFPDVPIELSASHLTEKANAAHHPFDISDVKNLVKALQSPVAVFTYGNKAKAQNAIVEITHKGKNFVVGVHFNQEKRGLVVSDIRGLYPKDNAEWLNWITQGKALYINKEKIQNLVDQQRRTLAEVEYLDLDSIAKVVETFENPTEPGKKLLDESENIQESGQNEGLGTEESAESGLQDEESGLLFRDEETGTETGGAAARASETVAGRRAAMADAARDAAARLGLDNVDIVEDASGLDGRLRDKKGWYDPRTGRITVVADNHTGAADVTRTLLHEGVAHHGLRGLFGEGFGEFVDGVYENATEDVRAAIDGMAARGGLTRAVATEEYLAGLAERGAFEGAGRGLWERVKNLFRTMLRKAGLKADALTDADLRYTLWQSYENLRRGGREAGVLDKAADMAKREELGIGNERETPDHWGKGGVLDKAAMAANGVDAGLLFRDSIEDTDDTARVIYNIRAGSALAAFIEAHVDGMRSVRMLQEAVMKQLGGTLEDWEDAYNEENRRHGHAQDEMEYFEKAMYEPLIKAVNEVAKLAKVSVGEVVEYMMAKSGIERNEVLARRDGRDVGQGARGHGVEGRNKVCDRGWLALV